MYYRIQHENCNNSRSYGEILKVWVDKQRRDYMLFIKVTASSMNTKRMQKLESGGFEWYEHDSVRVMWDNEKNSKMDGEVSKTSVLQGQAWAFQRVRKVRNTKTLGKKSATTISAVRGREKISYD